MIPQSYDVLTTYPFCQYRYSIDGKTLGIDQRLVTVPALVAIQELDKTGFPFVKLRNATANVTINFQVQLDTLRPQLQHLILSNVPAEGTYSFTLKIEAVLGGGRVVPVAEQSLVFQGQRINFPPGFISKSGGVARNSRTSTASRRRSARRISGVRTGANGVTPRFRS